MKKSRFTEEQITGVLKELEAGMKTVALCREHGISAATFCGWKSKYGGMDMSGCRDLSDLERMALYTDEISSESSFTVDFQSIASASRERNNSVTENELPGEELSAVVEDHRQQIIRFLLHRLTVLM